MAWPPNLTDLVVSTDPLNPDVWGAKLKTHMTEIVTQVTSDESTATIDLVDRTDNTTETVPAGTTTNCSTAGVTKTAPAVAGTVGAPPLRFAVKNLSTGTITVTYPDQTGATVNLVLLAAETRTFRQKSASGWGVESGAIAVSTLDARYDLVVNHGATAGTARPISTGHVQWIGSVAPTNAITDDLWWDTANKLAKRYNGSGWDTAGSGAYQPLDADLTGLADPTSAAGALVSDGSTWLRKTAAQFKTWLGMTASDVSAVPQASVALTAGQLFGSDGAGNTVAVNPTGSSQLGYGQNNTGTAQSGIGSTATDITSCSMSVAASTRPVFLTAGATFEPSAGGAGVAVSHSIVEVSNGVDTPVTVLTQVAAPSTTWVTGNIPWTQLAASTARTRTFKAQASIGSGTMTIPNGGFNLRSTILAMAG